jgi:TPR repeat protein
VKDEVGAARYYKPAADQNHVSAQKRYAVCLADGRGVATNEAETARCFELAAHQNHASAAPVPTSHIDSLSAQPNWSSVTYPRSICKRNSIAVCNSHTLADSAPILNLSTKNDDQ